MAVKAIRNKTWFAYFPEDYRWSYNIVITLAGAASGGADIGEVDQVCHRLARDVGNDNLWFREWTAMAERLRQSGFAEERRGHALSAAAFHKRASNYFQVGDRFRFPKDKRAMDAYRKSIDCFHRFIRLTDRPRIEVVDIPFEGRKKLAAYFVPAENTRKAKPPVAVLYNGFDGTKEMSLMWAADALTRRGMSVLVADSPGVGESIRFRKIYLRHDYEVAGAAALDYLEKRRDVNARRAAIVAPSLGGYYAPRTASMERRFKACVAWGAIWDYHATWTRRIKAAFESQLPVPGHHLTWSFNVKTLEEALEKLEGFRLDGVVQRMRCPFLLIHGMDDQQIPMRDARALFRAVGSKDKTFRAFNGPDGGAQHCHLDYISPVVHYMADWVQEKLGA